MGRKRRIWLPSYFYHIVSRGNHRDPLFHDLADYRVFLHILKQVYQKYPFEMASYCLMTNHYHMQIRSENHSLSKTIGRLNKQYVDYYNTKYSVSGHLFEERFFASILVDTQAMLDVSSYIHLNPVKAGIAQVPEAYHHSSYSYYLNPRKKRSTLLPYLDPTILLNYFPGSTITEQARKYTEYITG